MIEISKDEINRLVYKYLEDEGYVYTLFTFKNEAVLSDGPVGHSLVSLVGKGLQYLYGSKHLQGGEVVSCEAKFCLSEEHVCKAGKKPLDAAGAIHQVQGAMDVSVEEVGLAGAKTALLSCWNRDYLGIYTAVGEALGFGPGGLLWRREMKSLTALSWCEDDLVGGTKAGEVITVNVSSGRTRSYASHGKEVTRIRQRGRGILSSGRDGRIVMMNNGVTEVNVSESGIEDIVWMSEYGVGCSLSDFSVAFVDAEESMTSKIGVHQDKISGIGYEGSLLSTSSHDGTLGLWNTALMSGRRMTTHDGEVYDHGWMDGKAVTCGSDRFTRAWDTERSAPTFELKHEDKVMSVDCLPYVIASGSLDGDVILSDPRCGKVFRYAAGGSVSRLLFSESGSYLCICMSNSPPKLINLRYL